MNQFTKEELKYLHRIVQDFRDHDPTYGLRDKLQSLIDNYCEHENIARDTGRRMHICNDCGVPL